MSRRLHIAYVLPGYSAHEADRAIPAQDDLVRALSAHVDLHVIALRYPGTTTPYRWHNVPVTPLGAGQVRGIRRFTLWLRALQTLRHLHHDSPFDLIHATWADETGALASWAGRWLGIPSLVSVVGGELVALDDIDYGNARSPLGRWTARQALSATHLVVMSAYLRRQMPAVPDERVLVLPLGIPIDDGDERPKSRTPYRLVHVGSLVPVKAQQTLLEALRLLPVGYTLDMLGTGPLLQRLQYIAQRLGVDDRVTFHGKVSREQVFAHFDSAALHVYASLHEGMPVALLEAASRGLRSAGTAVGILPDDPMLGLSVPAGSALALADAIATLHDAPHDEAALVQHVRSNYSLDASTARLLALYADLTAK
ncbi:MAG: glycosyltransferase [Pleurocapsa minor GSE-CHR-MK-17-07R]|jgi:glycosyltransferase involved in cell wall biosynthesis|nr:glycosyltransferase [Pleurocapsa minor GSE-CHR-MK 17-07R]